jgi:hypothetical protein
MNRACYLTLFAIALSTASVRAQSESAVGVSTKIEALVLPGTELEATELRDRKQPVVIQRLVSYPHGSAFRYDIEYYGLEPGTHDLRKYLKRVDGSTADNLPPILVKVNPVLPPGQVEPHQLEIEKGPRIGGYRIALFILIALWGLGLVAILLSFFFPRRNKAAAAGDRPLSLADRLRPLVEGAAAGRLSQEQLAGLERGLMAYWRKRLRLETTEPGEAMEKLRKHPEAGPLLAQLEDWLHRPRPSAAVDVAKLLEPYRHLPPDEVDVSGGKP